MKRNIKNIMMACVLGCLIASGVGCAIPEQVSAAPFVKLDYGETNGHIHYFWTVDQGSISSHNGDPTVEVSKDDDYANMGYRKYYFSRTSNGDWMYCYEEWTGKGARKPDSSWYLVSDNRLANDILYIVLNS